MRARILVVDDQPGMLRALERVLEPRHEVLAASTAGQALALAEANGPDVAIVDIRMPDVDGFEVMRRLRGVCPDLDVIVMTGSASESDAHLVRAIRERAFYFVQKPFDREVLWTLIDRCLELRTLRQENRRHLMRLENELAQARRFQRSLFPPEHAVLRGTVIDARCIPSAELGGDLYDYAPAGEEGVALLVADVVGHGASAAMLTALVKSAFRASHVDDFAPLSVIGRIQSAIQAFSYNKLISVVCVRLSGSTGRLEYASAGHPAGLVWEPGREPRTMEATGPVISPALPGSTWKSRTLDLARDATLLLLTDGITETEGSEGFFGVSPVLRLMGGKHASGRDLLEAILEATREFSGGRPVQDDLTLLTASFR